MSRVTGIRGILAFYRVPIIRMETGTRILIRINSIIEHPHE